MGPSEERFVGALLQPLWDLGLTVGQHVRELTDFAEPATLDLSNVEFLLALLDVRFIAGDERLFQRLDGWVRGLGPDNRPAAARRACCSSWTSGTRPFNETVYQLEPDIKSAPGGLRDIAATRHIRLLKPGGTDTELDRADAAAPGGRRVLPARPLGSAPRERPRRQRADPRAAGESRRDVRLRGPTVAAAGRKP